MRLGLSSVFGFKFGLFYHFYVQPNFPSPLPTRSNLSNQDSLNSLHLSRVRVRVRDKTNFFLLFSIADSMIHLHYRPGRVDLVCFSFFSLFLSSPFFFLFRFFFFFFGSSYPVPLPTLFFSFSSPSLLTHSVL